MDGFRSLAYVHDGDCHLVPRRNRVYKLFDRLGGEIARTLIGRSAVLDGGIVCLDDEGRPQFYVHTGKVRTAMGHESEAVDTGFSQLERDLQSIREGTKPDMTKRLTMN